MKHIIVKTELIENEVDTEIYTNLVGSFDCPVEARTVMSSKMKEELMSNRRFSSAYNYGLRVNDDGSMIIRNNKKKLDIIIMSILEVL